MLARGFGNIEVLADGVLLDSSTGYYEQGGVQRCSLTTKAADFLLLPVVAGELH